MRLGDVLPANHLARFVVDIIAQLDLSQMYAGFAPVGQVAIVPEILLWLLFFAYVTGIYTSRKIEKVSYESIPMRCITGGLHPDHDTIAPFRKNFSAEIQDMFVQILLLAQPSVILKIGNISLDGSKIHANAPMSHVVSYKWLIDMEAQLKTEVSELLELGERADQGAIHVPEGMVVENEITIRQERPRNSTSC